MFCVHVRESGLQQHGDHTLAYLAILIYKYVQHLSKFAAFRLDIFPNVHIPGGISFPVRSGACTPSAKFQQGVKGRHTGTEH